jgi:glycosyltransferase 2 family protein
MRAHLRTIVIAAVTLALVAWFLRQADFAKVWREIRSARLDILALSLIPTSFTYVLRALRWQYLLAPIGPTRFSQAFRTTVIGFAANAVLPARIGEVVRPYLLARREGLSITATFATIILERLLDLVTVILMFGTFVFVFDPGMAAVNEDVYGKIKVGGGLAAAGALAALLMVAVLARQRAQVAELVERVSRVLPAKLAGRVAHLAHMFVHGMAVMRDPVLLGQSLLLSVALWLSIATAIWLVTVAFHMTIPFTGSFLILALLVVGVAVPTPGAVGGFHEAFRIGAATFYGIENDRAVGSAIVLHAVSFLPITLLGGWFMLQDGLSLTRVQRLSEEARATEAREEAEEAAEEAAQAARDAARLAAGDGGGRE